MRPRNGTMVALLLAILISLVPVAARAAVIHISPATANAGIGEVVSLAIQVDGAADLAGFQFDFQFAPASLEVKTITIAPAFEHQVKGSFDNGAGRGLVAAYRLGSTPLSGTNLTLATVEFTVKGGTAPVSFANQVLGTADGDEIPITPGTIIGTITSKAIATVTLEGLNQTYDGTAKTVTVTTVPPGLQVNITYDGSSAAPVNVGSYAVVATVNDAGYSGSASGTLVISGSLPFRIVGNPTRYYPTLGEAYLGATDNDGIEIKAGTVIEELTANQGITVYLKGGFDDVFSPNPSGYSTIQGKVSLKSGKVVMAGIRVRALPPVSDTTAPVVALSVVPPLTALTVQLDFTATDNVGVTGYMLSESSALPSANDPGWLGAAPAGFTFGDYGDKTLYAYARDAAGNVGMAVQSFSLTPVLTVQMLGDGAGTVTSRPQDTHGISCISGADSTGCSRAFPYGQTVDLLVATSTGSVFSGWGVDCSGSGDCSVVMTSPRTVTATFVTAPNVRIGTTSYASLQAAYDKAKNGDEIMLLGGMLGGQAGSLTANRDVSIVITGGYDASYIGVNTETVMQGQISLKAGTVKVKNLKLRP